MAGKTAILAVRIISDSSSATREFDKTGTAADRMGRRMQKASTYAKLGLVGVAAASVSAAKAAAQDQRSQALLAQTMQKNAGASASQIAATERWIDAMARATGVADDQLRPALGTLVRSTGDVATAQSALKTAMDVSAQTGKPLETVSAAIAKAYGGQTTALKRLIPGLDDATLKSGDMTKIMELLADKTGGAAATAANTAEGKFAKFKVTMGELQESLGTILLPIMGQLSDVMGTVATFAQEHTTTFQILVGVLAVLAVGVVAVNAAYKTYTAVSALMTLATKRQTQAQVASNVAMRANPVGLIVTAIALLVAGLILAYKKSETFRNIVNAVGRAGVTAFKTVWGWIQKAIDLVKKLIDWVKQIDWPSAPAWVTKLFGKGGGPSVTYSGGLGGFARSSLPGRGGPGDGAFITRMGGGSGTTLVNITVNGALDPDGVAKQILQLLRRYDVKLGGTL